MMKQRTYERVQNQMAAHFWRFLERARPACEDPRRGAYRATLSMETIEVYLRLRVVEVEGVRYWCVVVANIKVHPTFQGKGHFSIFVDVVQTLNPGEATCLECVINPLLRAWGRRHGWIEEPKEDLPITNPSFYFLKPGAQGIGSVEAFSAGQEESVMTGLNWDTWTLRGLRSYDDWRASRVQRPRACEQGISGEAMHDLAASS